MSDICLAVFFCFIRVFFVGRNWLVFWADDRKRYTATIPRPRAVQQNTPRFLTPIRDADWSTQPRTGFFRQLLAVVHRTAAFQLGCHRFLTRPMTLSVAKYTLRTDFAPGSSRPIAFHFPTESQPWAQSHVASIERRAFIFRIPSEQSLQHPFHTQHERLLNNT